MIAGLFWFSVGMIAYVYFGYPVILYLLSLILPGKKVKKAEITPSVTLIISVFNEEAILDEKLKNTMALIYPKEKLEILVVSDASADRSDEITRRYESEGVRLLRMTERGGKTLGLNAALQKAVGEIIIFSDANAMYQPDAIEKLARNFSDPEVGYATGESRYLIAGDATSVSVMENLYWTYEIKIKKLESQLGSMVGADGAIYAIRKKLYEELLSTDINDFVNPLQIIAKGYRGIYEAEAVCYEETAASFEGEFRRRERIISRSWRGLFRVSQLLNPFRFGCYSIELISHKLLRWLVPVMMWSAFLSNLALYAEGVLYKITLGLQLSFVFLALVGALCSYLKWNGKLFLVPYYIFLANIASLIGIYKGMTGRSQVIWNPDRQEVPGSLNNALGISLWPLSVTFCLIVLFASLTFSHSFFAVVSFWSAGFLLVFSNVGYLLFLIIFSSCFRKIVHKESCFPTVTLLVAAFNEDDVIEKKIKNSLALDYPKDKMKIIIASDGSTDQTNKIVRKYEEEGISLCFYSPRRGKITVLNQTIPKITSEITVLSDANTMYDTLAIKKLVSNFSDVNIGVVSGNVIIKTDDQLLSKSEGLYYKFERFIQKKETEIGCMVGVDGAMYAIRTKLFTPPSDNIILDDLVISMNIAKQGHRIVYEPEAIAYESGSTSIQGEFKRKVRLVAGGIQAIKEQEGLPQFFRQPYLTFQYIIHKLFRWLMPVFLVVILISNVALLNESFYFFLFVAQLSFYMFSIGRLFTDGEDKGFMSIPFYFCLVNLAAFVGLMKGLANLQPVTWEKIERS